jgi:hypothetical protein
VIGGGGWWALIARGGERWAVGVYRGRGLAASTRIGSANAYMETWTHLA